MKIIREPKVYLIARQEIVEEDLEKFLEEEGLKNWQTDTEFVGEKITEIGGRLCYMSFGQGRKTNREYIRNLIESRHGSVLEHVVWVFIVTGVSRGYSHEQVRHRAGWAYSQRSTRYVDETEGSFVVPFLLQKYPDLEEKFLSWCEEIQGHYKQLVGELMRRVQKSYPDIKKTDLRKLCRGTARSILPHAIETKIQISGNARGLRHFIEMRASLFNDPEIRRVAILILKRLQKEAPNIFGDYKIKQLPDGTEVAETKNIKV